MTLSGKVSQLQHPPRTPPVFVPVKATVSPPAGQDKPLPGEDAEAKAVDSIQITPVNLFSRRAKGTASGAQYYRLIEDFDSKINEQMTVTILPQKVKNRKIFETSKHLLIMLILPLRRL